MQVTTVTPAVTAAATFPALNGVAVNGAAAAGSIFRPTFARNPSTVATTAAAAFPGTPLLLQQSPQPMIQNGKKNMQFQLVTLATRKQERFTVL